MIIDWRVIPHKEQVYDTVGNWWWGDKISAMEDVALDNDCCLDDYVLHLRVSKMSNPHYSWLVGMHELTEALLCSWARIKPSDVDDFDVRYEDAREKGHPTPPCGCDFQDEPGDDRHAPYHRQHQVATICERILALFLGVSWADYELEIALL